MCPPPNPCVGRIVPPRNSAARFPPRSLQADSREAPGADGCRCSTSPPISLVIDNSLLLQLLKERTDVAANLLRIGRAKFLLQLHDDLAEGSLAVAALEHLPSRTLQFDCALRKKNHAVGFGAAPPASRRQSRLTCVCRRRHRHSPSPMRNAPGGGHPGCT